MYRIILLIHTHAHTHTHTLVTILFVKYNRIVGNTSPNLSYKHVWSFGVPSADSKWEKDGWPLLLQERRYHHAASIHLWQVLVKHTSRGNAALLSSRKTSTVRRKWSCCSLVCLSHLPQSFYLKGLMITKPRWNPLTLWIPVNKCPSTDGILLHFSSFHITIAGFSKAAFLKLCSADNKWSLGSALVVLLDWTLVQKRQKKKLTWIAYHTL